MKFKRVYLESQNFYLDLISDFVSGAYDHRSGGMIRLHLSRFSWYICFTNEIEAWMSHESEDLSHWNFVFCICSTCHSGRSYGFGPASRVSPVQRFLGCNSSCYISRTRRSFSLKFRTLYQQLMTNEEVVRHGYAFSSSASTESFRNSGVNI